MYVGAEAKEEGEGSRKSRGWLPSMLGHTSPLVFVIRPRLHAWPGLNTESCRDLFPSLVQDVTLFPRDVDVPDLDQFVPPLKSDHGHLFNNNFLK